MIHCIAPYDVPHFEREDGGFTLFIFGDRQEGAKGYVPEAWETFRDEFIRCKNAKAALGLGDYGDWLRPSLRPVVKGALGKDDSARRMLDKAILKEHDTIIRAHDFLEGRVLGLHEGHHNWTTLDAINLDQRLSSALRARFLGFAASIRLTLRGEYGRTRERKYDPTSRVVTMVTTHGNANGRKVAGALSWVENNLANSYGADIYVTGHGCKSGTSSPFERNDVRRVGPPGLKRSVPRILAVGGFCRGWTNGWESDYVEQNGMSPQPLAWAKIHFHLANQSAARECVGAQNRASKILDIDARPRYFTETDGG